LVDLTWKDHFAYFVITGFLSRLQYYQAISTPLNDLEHDMYSDYIHLCVFLGFIIFNFALVLSCLGNHVSMKLIVTVTS